MESKRPVPIPQPYPEPRLVTRSSQSDLVELVIKEQEVPRPEQFINESKTVTTKTIVHSIENAPNGRAEYSPNIKRTYQSSVYTTGSDVSPISSRPPFERERDREPLRKIDNVGSPSTLRSALSKPKKYENEPFSMEEVVIYKGQGPLGLSIVGGKDHSSLPFGTDDNDPGVFISKVSSFLRSTLIT